MVDRLLTLVRHSADVFFPWSVQYWNVSISLVVVWRVPNLSVVSNVSFQDFPLFSAWYFPVVASKLGAWMLAAFPRGAQSLDLDYNLSFCKCQTVVDVDFFDVLVVLWQTSVASKAAMRLNKHEESEPEPLNPRFHSLPILYIHLG
jgi:hypothetical protein